MKKYNKVIYSLCGVMLLFLTSCLDWDFDTDASTEQLFRTPKIETVELEANSALLHWNKVPLADYYLLELSQDSLEFTTDLVTLGEDQSITENEYLLTDLIGNTRYSVRIQTRSASGIKDSEFATFTFKTRAEQILYEVSNIAGKKATVIWDASKVVDRLELVVEGEDNPVIFELTEEDKERGEKELIDLVPSTTYFVSIWKGETQRGKRSFTTTEDYPEGYTVINLTDEDDIQAILDEQKGKIIIVFPKETEMEVPSLNIPKDITSTIFWGAVGGEFKSTLNYTGDLTTSATNVELIRFYNLKITGKGSNYVINQDKESDIDLIKIDNCEIEKLRGVIRIKDTSVGTFREFELSNNIIKDIGNYGLINTTKSSNYIVEKVSITNSTIIKMERGIEMKQDDVDILIENCTFYNSLESGRNLVHSNKATGISFTVKSTIFACTLDYKDKDDVKACDQKLTIFTDNNNYMTNDFIWRSGYEIPGMSHNSTAEELFEDAENGNFKIADPTFTGIAGDPRWRD